MLKIVFRPAIYINVSTTRYNCWGLSTSTHKRNKRENNANDIGLVKTMMNRNRCDNRKILTMLLTLRNAAYHAAPSRRNTTTMTLPGLVPGFPMVRVYPTPLRKERWRTWASLRQSRSSRQGFPPTANQPRPRTIHRTPSMRSGRVSSHAGGDNLHLGGN